MLSLSLSVNAKDPSNETFSRAEPHFFSAKSNAFLAVEIVAVVVVAAVVIVGRTGQVHSFISLVSGWNGTDLLLLNLDMTFFFLLYFLLLLNSYLLLLLTFSSSDFLFLSLRSLWDHLFSVSSFSLFSFFSFLRWLYFSLFFQLSGLLNTSF